MMMIINTYVCMYMCIPQYIQYIDEPDMQDTAGEAEMNS